MWCQLGWVACAWWRLTGKVRMASRSLGTAEGAKQRAQWVGGVVGEEPNGNNSLMRSDLLVPMLTTSQTLMKLTLGHV
jgi:hypothetical protein